MPDQDGMDLACAICRWRPDGALTQGVAAAHFETEHATADVKFELVVICHRCDVEMPHELTTATRTGLLKHRHQCTRCHRSRIITQRPEADCG